MKRLSHLGVYWNKLYFFYKHKVYKDSELQFGQIFRKFRRLKSPTGSAWKDERTFLSQTLDKEGINWLLGEGFFPLSILTHFPSLILTTPTLQLALFNIIKSPKWLTEGVFYLEPYIIQRNIHPSLLFEQKTNLKSNCSMAIRTLKTKNNVK